MKIKKLLCKTQPAKYFHGKFSGFRVVKDGEPSTRVRGVTKSIAKKLFSSGTLPLVARRGEARPGGHWKGKNGGRRRGKCVDAQVSRLVNGGAKIDGHVFQLTKAVFAALEMKKLKPVIAQRTVASEAHRLGSAIDIMCLDETNALVLVELKCGFDKYRKVAAVKNNVACKMRKPLQDRYDSTLNRHMLQLTVTYGLFMTETETLAELKKLGITRVRGLLLYAADHGAEFHVLSKKWRDSAADILNKLK